MVLAFLVVLILEVATFSGYLGSIVGNMGSRTTFRSVAFGFFVIGWNK